MDDSEVPDNRNSHQSEDFNFEISTSPNPFHDFIQLKYSSPVPQNADINISDISGRLVYSSNTMLNATNNEQLTIPTEDWSSGFYILTLKTETSHESIKLIKR